MKGFKHVEGEGGPWAIEGHWEPACTENLGTVMQKSSHMTAFTEIDGDEMHPADVEYHDSRRG